MTQQPPFNIDPLAASERDDAVPASIAAPAPPNAAPVSRPQRLSSIDALRGIAVLGILLMNITAFGLPYWAYVDPSVAGGSTGANLWTWIVTEMLFEGTFRTIFSMLFGAGIILLTSRLEERRAVHPADARGPGVAAIHYRRNVWLVVFGIIDAWVLLWTGDILYLYGLLGLLLYPLRHCRPATLIIGAVLVLAVLDSIYVWEWRETVALREAAAEAEDAEALGMPLSPDQEDALNAWRDRVSEDKPSLEELEIEKRSMQGGYLDVALALAPYNFWFETVEVVRSGLWDAGAMMLLGMALMKLGVLSAARSSRFYVIMLALGYVVGLGVNAYETIMVARSGFSVDAMAQATVTYDLGRLGVALGHIGLFMLLFMRGSLAGTFKRLAAVGQMALTNYLMASVLCGLVFHGYGLSLYGELDRWQLYLVVLGVWIVQLTISPIWLRYFHFGPVEWLWRSLTYWRRQPMRRHAAQTDE